MINQNLAAGLTVAKSKINGKGCFTAVTFRPDQKIAEYVGERISSKEAERRLRASSKKCICEVNSEWSIDGSRGGNGTQYVNHSCEPNAYVIISHGRVFLHALRCISPGEEITTDYLYELGLDRTRCNCQTASCPERTGLASITPEDKVEANRSPHTHQAFRPTCVLGELQALIERAELDFTILSIEEAPRAPSINLTKG